MRHELKKLILFALLLSFFGISIFVDNPAFAGKRVFGKDPCYGVVSNIYEGQLLADVDGDGDVDYDDLYLLSISYGTEVGDPDYDPNADLDNDGDININDLYEMTIRYGLYQVTVHVQDQYGNPLWAIVSIQAGADIIADDKTDPETGNAYFCLPNGLYLPRVWYGGDRKAFNKFTVPDKTYVEICWDCPL